MENNKTITPSTESGRRWLKTYLHPPSANADVTGIPDQSAQSSVSLEWPVTETIAAPDGTGTGTWCALVVAIPCPQFPAIVYTWKGDEPADVAGITARWVHNRQFVFGDNANSWKTNAARFRPYAGSTTVTFDASDLYNQGKVWAGQTAIANLASDRTGTAFVADEYLHEWDQWTMVFLPTQGSQLMGISEKYYSGLAKEGSYTPQGFSNPAMQYDSGIPKYGQFSGNFRGTDPISTWVAIGDNKINPSAAEMSAMKKTVPVYEGFTTGVHLYKGLLAQATLEVKCIVALEVLPQVGSAWSPFVSGGPVPDFLAIEAAAIEKHNMQDAYPASANSLGSILSTVGSFVLPAVKNLLRSFLNPQDEMTKVVQAPIPAPRPQKVRERIVYVEAPRLTPIPAPRKLVPAPAPASQQLSKSQKRNLKRRSQKGMKREG